MAQNSLCAVCPETARWGTRVQPEYGAYVDGPQYCDEHLSWNITQLAAQFITVVVGAIGADSTAATYAVDLEVTWEGPALSQSHAWHSARRELANILDSSSQFTVASRGYQPSKVSETLESRRQRHG